MLIQSLKPGTIEGALSFVPRIVPEDISCDQIPGAENWQDYSSCDRHSQGGFRNLLPNIDGSCSLNTSSARLQISNCTTMSGSSVSIRVYKRKKHEKTSLASCPVETSMSTGPGDGSNSSISFHAFSKATKEHATSVEAESEGTGSPHRLSVQCNTDGLVSKSGSSNGCLVGEEPCSEEALRSDPSRILDVCGIDDSCSSSRLNLGVVIASPKTDMDDTGECSSSAVCFSERSWDNMSVKDICISILRSQGFLQQVSAHQHNATVDDCANYCSRKCKVCNGSETTLNMLICDNCEDAFHASCCYPRIKKIPIDDWFCYSCLKKKRKLLMEKCTSNSPNIKNGSGQSRNVTSGGELGPIESMLKDMEPSKFPVRIGHEFQAEIPDCPHPIIDEVDPMTEAEEMTPSDYLSFCNSSKTPHLSSIGNWIQCQQVIEGIGEHVDGTICGKWRRAPLFEVQTDDWECFHAVLWDPAHADCAVPQELPTDEVLRQLKYIEKSPHPTLDVIANSYYIFSHLELRPRLAAKRQRLDQTKSSCSQVSKQK